MDEKDLELQALRKTIEKLKESNALLRRCLLDLIVEQDEITKTMNEIATLMKETE